MINLTDELLPKYSLFLTKKLIPISLHNDYKKWLRFYLDFCHKYHQSYVTKDPLWKFIEKLRERKQSVEQQKQAEQSVSFYYEMLQSNIKNETADNIAIKAESSFNATTAGKVSTDLSPEQVLTDSKSNSSSNDLLIEWKKLHADLVAEIKVRHYSPKTLKAYAMWLRKFQLFTQNKSPYF